MRADRCICRADCEGASVFATSVKEPAPQYGRTRGLPSGPFQTRPPDTLLMLLPIAPTPPDTTAVRHKWQRPGRLAAAIVVAACIALGAPHPRLGQSAAGPQQPRRARPAARIYALAAVLRLSKQFIGRLVHHPRGAGRRVRQDGSRLHGRRACQARHHRCAEGGLGPHRPARLHARASEVCAGRLCQVFRAVPHRRPDHPRLRQRAATVDRGRQRDAGGHREGAGGRQDDGKDCRPRSLYARLPRAVQGGRHARRHQQGLYA